MTRRASVLLALLIMLLVGWCSTAHATDVWTQVQEQRIPVKKITEWDAAGFNDSKRTPNVNANILMPISERRALLRYPGEDKKSEERRRAYRLGWAAGRDGKNPFGLLNRGHNAWARGNLDASIYEWSVDQLRRSLYPK